MAAFWLKDTCFQVETSMASLISPSQVHLTMLYSSAFLSSVYSPGSLFDFIGIFALINLRGLHRVPGMKSCIGHHQDLPQKSIPDQRYINLNHRSH